MSTEKFEKQYNIKFLGIEYTKAFEVKDVLNSDIAKLQFEVLEKEKKWMSDSEAGAFLKNIDLFEEPTSTEEQKSGALRMIKELLPEITASALHRHAAFKNKVIEELLSE